LVKRLARKLIEAGCDIYIHYFSGEDGPRELIAIAQQRGQGCGYADLTSEADAARCVAEAAAFLGGIDILVNNVGGIIARKWLGEIDPQFWRTVIDVNMTTMLNVTQSALPWLKEATDGASIVNLASLSRTLRRALRIAGLFDD
jgi:3-oxoacyl-[acyl-carrier protein] reductase